MQRLVSFVMLTAIILLIGALFFRVMAYFLVPMFLAVLLVVIFKPLHIWFLAKLKQRETIAALLTTGSILLIVLLPLTWIAFRGVSEGVSLAREFDQQALIAKGNQAALQFEPMLDKVGFDWGQYRETLSKAITTLLENYFGPAAWKGLKLVLGMVVGLAIMVISLYYFLVDGPGMIKTFMRLSPLDDRYEQQLLDEFVTVSRAVVIASLLSAVVQGILAGISYWVLGMPLLFLLTALTMLVALVPFVGAAGIWVPCCLWLWLFDGRPAAAVGLAVYGTLVISMSDNIIKPLVLSGKSRLHPLLALLSILGGLQALGPIGILVGPMLVAFLQSLLVMLRTEMDELEKQTQTE